MAGIQAPQTATNPLVRVATNSDLQAAEDKKNETEPGGLSFNPLSAVTGSALAGHIRKAWETNKLHKEKVSQSLLYCLRARRGVYSAGEIAELQATGGSNIAFADLTETKCRAASAWVRDVLMPTGGQPAWGVDHTPMPDLPLETKDAIIAKASKKAREVMGQIAQAGGDVVDPVEFRQMAIDLATQMRDDVLREYKKRAKRSAERMEEKIADAMAQGGWDEAMDEFVEDFVTFPAAILMGPFYGRKHELKWLPGFRPAVSNDARQRWARKSPFDVYPAPYATNCQDGDLVVRLRLRPKEIYDCIGVKGYFDKEIREVLKHFRAGHLEGWVWTDAERYRLEQETLHTFLSPAGVIDGLHYWGSAPAWMLASWGIQGVDLSDMEKEYEIEAILIGPYIIRCTINSDPLGKRPYHKACYDAVPGAFWGRSIPDLCKLPQRMCNAIVCAVADNLGIASGPMGWVHADRLADGETSMDIGPWRMFQLKSDPTQGTNPGIGFFQPNSNVAELMQAYDKWEIKADDSTGVPRYTYGNERIGGAGSTASGLSMLLNSAAKGLRRGISNVDMNVIGPSVNQAFINEMLYGKDMDAKGDCVVVARGANAILIKETAQQHRQMALALVTGNPILTQIMGMEGIAELLREVLLTLDIDPEQVPSADELAKRAEQQAQMQAQQMQAMQEAEMQKVQADVMKNQQANQTKLAIAEGQNTTTKQVVGAKIAGDLAKMTGGGDGAPAAKK